MNARDRGDASGRRDIPLVEGDAGSRRSSADHDVSENGLRRARNHHHETLLLHWHVGRFETLWDRE